MDTVKKFKFPMGTNIQILSNKTQLLKNYSISSELCAKSGRFALRKTVYS